MTVIPFGTRKDIVVASAEKRTTFGMTVGSFIYGPMKPLKKGELRVVAVTGVGRGKCTFGAMASETANCPCGFIGGCLGHRDDCPY